MTEERRKNRRRVSSHWGFHFLKASSCLLLSSPPLLSSSLRATKKAPFSLHCPFFFLGIFPPHAEQRERERSHTPSCTPREVKDVGEQSSLLRQLHANLISVKYRWSRSSRGQAPHLVEWPSDPIRWLKDREGRFDQSCWHCQKLVLREEGEEGPVTISILRLPFP